MNNNDLKYFLVLAKELNFTKAAKILFISQQALSQRIKNIETTLKVKLFKRTSPLELTQEGIYFLKKAEYILSFETALKKEIISINSKKKEVLKLGVTYTRGTLILPALLKRLYELNPSLHIILKEGTTNDLELALKRSEIDLYIGFPTHPTPSITSELLTIDEFFIVIPRTILSSKYPLHPKNQLKTNLNSLVNYPFIKMKNTTFAGKMFESFCKTHNFYPKVILETENIMTMISLSFIGLGCMLCSKSFLNFPCLDLNQDIILIPTEQNFGRQYIAINYQIESTKKKFIRNAIEIIKKELKEY